MTRYKYNPQDQPIRGDRVTDRLGALLQSPRRRVLQWIKDPGAATITAVGLAAPTISGTAGTPVSGDDSTGPAITLPTSTGIEDAVRIVSSTFTEFRRDWEPTMDFVINTGASIATIRLWAGMFSETPETAETLGSAAAADGAGFSYDTTRDSTAFWRFITSDGVADTVTNTGIPIAVSTNYKMRIVCLNSPAVIRAYMDTGSGYVLVAEHSLLLPTSTQLMGPAFTVTSLPGVSGIKRLVFRHLRMTTN